jgi:hypothetical protein
MAKIIRTKMTAKEYDELYALYLKENHMEPVELTAMQVVKRELRALVPYVVITVGVMVFASLTML